MTQRPCVRCGRSIGEAYRSCRVCTGEIHLDHPEQWSDEGYLRHVAWDRRRADSLMDRPDVGQWAFPPLYSDHIREAHLLPDGRMLICEDALMTTRGHIAIDGCMEAWVELTPEFMTFTAPPASTEDLAPIWRHIDGWLYELTGDRPE